MKQGESSDDLFQEGYRRARDLLLACSLPEGFLANPSDVNNYRRIWGRDGVIVGLAALLTEEPPLVETFRRTLETLARYQGPHGEIPSNVDPQTERVSYGGTAGRVDANLWFVIGCGEYWKASGDDAFLNEMLPALERVRFLLGAWEFNNRGLLYIPTTGDWADEYIHNGYVLYDQLLYLQVVRTFLALRNHIYGERDQDLYRKAFVLKHLISDNYWFEEDESIPDAVYHEFLYVKGKAAAESHNGHFWLPFFSPGGYGYRFDGLANVLASLLGVADDERRKKVDNYIANLTEGQEILLLPAFHPVINEIDADWKHLNMNFSYTFKNKPYEFHNGGLWPMITGFYVADLARRNDRDTARKYLAGIHEANACESDDQAWCFPEYINGRDFRPGGTRNQGWSAAAAIIGHQALEGRMVLRIDDQEY
jgi:hypothetical protein